VGGTSHPSSDYSGQITKAQLNDTCHCVWGIDIPRVLTDTETCHGLPNWLINGLPCGMGQQATTRLGKLDQEDKD
jgi:hypothetical protein